MQNSKITAITQFLFLAVIFLLPVFFLPLNLMALEPLKIFAALMLPIVVAIVFLLGKIRRNSFFISRSPIWLSMAAVLLSTLLSSVFSNNAGISLFGRQLSLGSFVGTLALFTLAYEISALFTDARYKERLFLAVHFSLLIVLLLQLLNIFLPFMPAMGFFASATSNTVGKWYDLGLFSLFGLLSSVLILQHLRHSRIYRVVGWLGFVLSATLVILVNSALVWLLAGGFALMYVVINAIVQRDSATTQQRVSYPALAVLILSVVFILVGGKFGMLLNSTFQFQFEEVRPTLSSTFEVIGDTLKADPAFGTGVNRFETSWLLNRPMGVNASNFWDTDFNFGYSNLLSIPVTHGIVGTLAWLMLIGVGLYYAFRLLFAPSESRSDAFVNTYSVLGFTFFLAVMLVYVPSTVLIVLFYVFLGFLIANLNTAGLIPYREVQIDQNPRVSFAYIFGLVVLLVAFIYAGFVVASQYASRVIYDRATAAYARDGNLDALESEINKAQFVYASDIYFRSLSEVGLLRISQILQDQGISQAEAVDRFKAQLQATVGYAQGAIGYDQQSYANRMSLLAIYKNLVPLEVPGAKDEAIRVLDDLQGLSPDNPSINLERARVYSLAKEYDSATAQIQRAIELKPNYVDAVFLLSQIQVEKGEIDQAVISIQAALSVEPYDPNLYFQLGLLRYNQGNYNDAVTAFENAVMLSPYFGNAKYFLGLSYYQNNRTSDAVTQFQNLAQLYPDNQEIAFILGNLQSGKPPLDGAQPPIDSNPEDREDLPVDEDAPAEADGSDAAETVRAEE